VQKTKLFAFHSMKKGLFFALMLAFFASCAKEEVKAPQAIPKIYNFEKRYFEVDTQPAYSSKFYGVNTFPWIPVQKIKMFRSFRVYIASSWIWRPGGIFVQPMYQAETQESSGLDVYFAKCKKSGIDVMPCINQTPEWYRPENEWSGSNNYPPIKKGLDRENPASYSDYAEFWFQFVCRYGSQKHPDSVLRVDTTPRWSGDIPNVKKSGLNLISQIEIGNEFDRWWDIGTERYLTPKEHAALFSAVIKRVREADKKMKVIMAGLTGFDEKYLLEFLQHLQAFGSELPDIINVHHYSNTGNEFDKWPPTWYFSGACMPNEDKDFGMIDSIVSIAHSVNRPVWVTEFGCDSRPQSWMHIEGSKYGMSDEQAQGTQIVETYKAYKKTGVSRAFMFMAADEPGQGLWQSCGVLTSQNTGYNKKQSYEIVRQHIYPK